MWATLASFAGEAISSGNNAASQGTGSPPSSGDALGYATGGNKVFNFGANPNAGLAGGSAVSSIFSTNNLLIVGAVVVGVAWVSRKRGK